MQLKIFFPAPSTLPVLINPSRGDNEVLKLLIATDWSALLQIKTDRLVKVGALWLFGFLEESHRLAQQDNTREGKYWHALIHRSEGYFNNSLYWFSQVGEHPIFKSLRNKWALEKEYLEVSQEWSPKNFVTLCKQIQEGNSETRSTIDLQLMAQIEYNSLMQFVLHQAKY